MSRVWLMDEDLRRRAVALASAARDSGNQPYGSLLASAAGEVLLEAQNTEVTESDVTGHAEINLVRLASRAYGRSELGGTTLYASTEPCAMCAGAIYWSGIGRVVFALAGSALLALTGDDPESPSLNLPCREVFAAGLRAIEVLGPYALPEALEVHRDVGNRAG